MNTLGNSESVKVIKDLEWILLGQRHAATVNGGQGDEAFDTAGMLIAA